MRPTTNILLTILLFGVILSSCDKKNFSKSAINENKITDFDLNAAKVIIQEKTLQFTKAHITKDTAFLNNSFSEDAKIFPPNSEIVVGQKAIAKLNYDWVNYGIHEFKEETLSFYGNEDYLIDEGKYYLNYGVDNTIDEGKYINIWKSTNGEWKIYSNIWNTNLPVELD